MQNFEWPSDPVKGESAEELDEKTLVESYSLQEIEMKSHFSAADFDASNEEYAFGH